MPSKTLIFIPTYNECGNAPRMCEEIHKLGLDADVLFVDDNSPDGTGKLLEEIKPRFPRLIVHHRSGKLGIGSAHFDAIQWAYDQGYELMVTMDCDFTHSPTDIPQMIAAAEKADVVVGSRWVHEKSLPGWNIFRRCMTWLGHFLTRTVLSIPQDASGAFRVYRLSKLPLGIFHLVQSRGYSFFFESLYIFNYNRIPVSEVAIVLPARTYGHSKMSSSAAWKSARYIFELYLEHLQHPERFALEPARPEIDPTISDPQDWDTYWNGTSYRDETRYGGACYDIIAGVYRRAVIKRTLEKVLNRIFRPGSSLLHAGCGSGQVDTDLQNSMRITAVDISEGALRRYCKNNPHAFEIKHGNIFKLPFPNNHFDGIYNLGVMEHFTSGEIQQILSEFRRVLKPNGTVVLFWPHAWATSVLALDIIHFLLKLLAKNSKKLHPAEVSLLKSKKQAEATLAESGLKMTNYSFGMSDFFVQAVIVATNQEQAQESSVEAPTKTNLI